MDPMQNQLCRVCDEPAAGFHFGAFTCEGCKSFFGRTCNNQSVISECKNNYRCVVDKKNRTSCKACRLRKCLMVGMSKSGSRYGRRSNWFKIHCLMQQKTGPSTSNTEAAPSLASQPKVEAAASPVSAVSRSPSPQSPNTSLESLSKKSSLSSPQSEADSGLGSSPPLSSLYSPLSLLSPASSPLLPFYKLSPLLAAHSPLLANPLLLSLAGHPPPPPAPVSRSHLELLSEHRELLARFGAARSALASLAPEAEDRPVSPPSVSDSPMDLRMRLSATAFLTPTLATPPSPSSSSPDDEGIEVDIGDKSDTTTAAREVSREAPGSVLDLTVSS